jgi:hypothetical protein
MYARPSVGASSTKNSSCARLLACLYAVKATTAMVTSGPATATNASRHAAASTIDPAMPVNRTQNAVLLRRPLRR